MSVPSRYNNVYVVAADSIRGGGSAIFDRYQAESKGDGTIPNLLVISDEVLAEVDRNKPTTDSTSFLTTLRKKIAHANLGAGTCRYSDRLDFRILPPQKKLRGDTYDDSLAGTYQTAKKIPSDKTCVITGSQNLIGRLFARNVAAELPQFIMADEQFFEMGVNDPRLSFAEYLKSADLGKPMPATDLVDHMALPIYCNQVVKFGAHAPGSQSKISYVARFKLRDDMSEARRSLLFTTDNKPTLEDLELRLLYEGSDSKIILGGYGNRPQHFTASSILNFTPRYTEQAFVATDILDPRISSMMVVGKAGAGKTRSILSGMIAAIQPKYDFRNKTQHQSVSRLYDRLLLGKPIVDAGESLGFLPGDVFDKVGPHFDSISELFEEITDGHFNYDCITHKTKRKVNYPGGEFELDGADLALFLLAFQRGKTIPRGAMMFLTEGQNASVRQATDLICRKGVESLLIIDGDTQQTDLQYDNIWDISLPRVARKFIGHPWFAIHHLKKGQRSIEAELARNL